MSYYDPSTGYYANADPNAAMPKVVHGPTPQLNSNALWIGDIDVWMDENFVMGLFAATNEVTQVKLIRDKTSGLPVGYGFVYFTSPESALKVLHAYNGQPIPGTGKFFRLNYAIQGASNKLTQIPAAVPVPKPRTGSEAESLFIGDLSPEVTEPYLLQYFQYYYPSCYSAKVIMDPATNQPKGYGFVYFSDETERARALVEMQGAYVGYKQIKVREATRKSASNPSPIAANQPNHPNLTFTNPNAMPPQAPQPWPGAQFQPAPQPHRTFTRAPGAPLHAPPHVVPTGAYPHPGTAAAYPVYTNPYPHMSTPGYPPHTHHVIPPPAVPHMGSTGAADPPLLPPGVALGNYGVTNTDDPSNITVFVGNITPLISTEILKAFFAPLGEIAAIKMHTNKGYAFIEFVNHEVAKKVLDRVHGFVNIGGTMVKVAWGRMKSKFPGMPGTVVPPGLGDSGKLPENSSQPGQEIDGKVEENSAEISPPQNDENENEEKRGIKRKEISEENSNKEEEEKIKEEENNKEEEEENKENNNNNNNHIEDNNNKEDNNNNNKKIKKEENQSPENSTENSAENSNNNTTNNDNNNNATNTTDHLNTSKSRIIVNKDDDTPPLSPDSEGGSDE